MSTEAAPSTETATGNPLPHWTRELPPVDGFYWYREAPGHYSQIVEMDDGDVLYEGDWYFKRNTSKLSGEFWSEPLTPPTV